jgi:hypothetical protein
LRLGLELDALGNLRRFAALTILRPLFGKIKFTVHQCLAMLAGIGQEYADSAILDAAHGARSSKCCTL